MHNPHPGGQHTHAESAHSHSHEHGVIDPSLLSSERGIWAVKWSLVALLVTAILQVSVVVLTDSIALLADTIHNFGDALTAIPLWIAFQVGKRPPNRRFTYGYGRLEDLAGLAVVLMIFSSAVLAGYESIRRFFYPQPVHYLWAVGIASLFGFVGNEFAALFRLRVGKQIGSAALAADGMHALVDGITSLAVLAGAVGVWLGFPWADPFIGLGITIAILKILWDSSKPVFARLLDGVDPQVIDEIEHTLGEMEGVKGVGEVRMRWLGHRLHAEANIALDSQLSVSQGHAVAVEARHQLLHELEYLSNATIHVDPLDASGELYHGFARHQHGGLSTHSHQ